jgi:hypothetical protein
LRSYNFAREYQLGAGGAGIGETPGRSKKTLFDNAAKGAIANRSVGARIA